MKLILDYGENSEGMYELLNSIKECINNNVLPLVNPVHIKSVEIVE
jgi:hypothetical protein